MKAFDWLDCAKSPFSAMVAVMVTEGILYQDKVIKDPCLQGIITDSLTARNLEEQRGSSGALRYFGRYWHFGRTACDTRRESNQLSSNQLHQLHPTDQNLRSIHPPT